MCSIDPTNLAPELSELRIGQDAIDWYQEELDRYTQLSAEADSSAATDASTAAGKAPETEQLQLLAGFSKPFLRGGES